MPKLIIKKGDFIVRKLSAAEDILAFTVGSEQGNDIIVKDDRISLFHLQFEKQVGQYYVRDLQSQWGTSVNGVKISRRTALVDQDEITLGDHVITFLCKRQRVTRSLQNSHQPSGQARRTLEDRINSVPSLRNLNQWLATGEVSPKPSGAILGKENQRLIRTAFAEIERSSTKTLATTKKEDESEKKPRDDIGRLRAQVDFQESARVSDLDIEIPSEALLRENPLPRNGGGAAATDKLFFDEVEIAEDVTETKRETSAGEDANREESNYFLLGIYGYYLGRKYKLNRPVTRIGRDRRLNDIVIKRNSKGHVDQCVSRRHATIHCKNDKYYLTDKRSKSRTWVNRRKLHEDDHARLLAGDEIELISDKKSHILRFVEEGNWDYSFPRKTGAWHIRHRLKLVNFYSLALLLVASFTLFSSYQNKNYVTDRPDPLVVNETVWAANQADTRFNGVDRVRFSNYPAVTDVNNDRFLDVVYIDHNGVLKCIDGRSKEHLWQAKFKSLAAFPVMLADLYNQGRMDIVVISDKLRLIAVDSKWGRELWRSPIMAGPLTGAPVIGDFDGDGFPDVAVVSSANSIYIGLLRPQQNRWSKLDLETPIRSVASAADMTGSGRQNILVGTETGKILVIDGTQRTIIDEINVNEELNKAIGHFDQNNSITFPPALGDLNGDGIDDLVVISSQGNILALNGKNSERFWHDAPVTSGEFPAELNHCVVLGDLDGDQLPDIVSITPDGKVRALKGIGKSKDRKMIMWEHTLPNGGKFKGYPVLADFNKNRTMDVVVSSVDGQLFIIEGSTGEILWQQNSQQLSLTGLPLVGDFDKDHRLDIIVLKSDGKFYKLETNSLSLESEISWSQMYANSRHTNLIDTRNYPIGNYNVSMGLSVFLILAVTGGNFFFRTKRKNLNYY